MAEGQLVIPTGMAAELTRLGVPEWTRRDGTTVYLDDMQDGHIQSALAILIRWRRDCLKRDEADTAQTLRETIQMLKFEQRRRSRLQRQTLHRQDLPGRRKQAPRKLRP